MLNIIKRIILIGFTFISVAYSTKKMIFEEINLFRQYEYFYLLENIICIAIGFVISRLVGKGLTKI